MIDLELLGVGADGESLVFTDTDGERYVTALTEELRSTIRSTRPHIEAADARKALRPRDIQALLRAGASAEDIAAEHNMDAADVARFEPPITAEKNYAIQRALETTVGTENGGPTMGDMVLDRLAARGVNTEDITWSAQRESGEPWQIHANFTHEGTQYCAQWQLSSAGTVDAVNDDARLLTEAIAQRPTMSIFTPLPVREAPPEPQDSDAEDLKRREDLIDQLNAARGKRQDTSFDFDDLDDLDEDDFEDFNIAFSTRKAATEAEDHSISAQIYSLASARAKREAHPFATDIDEEPSTGALAALKPLAPSEQPADPTSHADAELELQLPVELGESRDVEQHNTQHRSDASPQAQPQPESLPGLENIDQPAQPQPKKSKSRRRSVPSWDEILFGSKPQ